MKENLPPRKEQEQIKESEGRLPPGQSLARRFPILHYGPVPQFSLENWDFQIWGEVETPRTLNWEEINQLPKTKLTMDIHCVTRWSVFDTTWEGISLHTLVDQGILKLLPTAKYVIQHAEQGYSTNLPLDILLSDNFLLATHYDGKPLTPEHGAPLRGVVGAIPGKKELTTPYFWKGAKWLRGLEFRADDAPGFWEKAGYHNEGDVWKEERTAEKH